MNRIPRKATKLDVTFLIKGNPGEDHMIAVKDPYRSGWIGTDDNGKRWSLFTSHLRDSNICTFTVLE